MERLLESDAAAVEAHLLVCEECLKNRKRGLQLDCRRCIVDGSVQFSKEMCMAVAANIHMAIGLRTAHRRPTRFA